MQLKLIFSTNVEMNRVLSELNTEKKHFLYERGDEPLRWSPKDDRAGIFSTNVEMNRGADNLELQQQDFLYERGDEPELSRAVASLQKFSLRTWR